jgi:hypothetical protein
MRKTAHSPDRIVIRLMVNGIARVTALAGLLSLQWLIEIPVKITTQVLQIILKFSNLVL